uniref:Uncharacterized protein n=1 Tax=Schistosoma japonicum TaxID=6182 RepID=C7TRF0_SCHJA|nr:hypothetical protein [Schistosoma japonicum]CAX80178.1 hypothetical protein [Schistosoma japonicum]CAX80198.1 hypothetical protein [Schistosoma japonicum]
MKILIIVLLTTLFFEHYLGQLVASNQNNQDGVMKYVGSGVEIPLNTLVGGSRNSRHFRRLSCRRCRNCRYCPYCRRCRRRRRRHYNHHQYYPNHGNWRAINIGSN